MTAKIDGFKTLGGTGIRYDDNGTLYVGISPMVRKHYAREEEQADGTFKGVGEPNFTIDMQPTIVSSADLIEALMAQNDGHRAVEFLGHVRVVPTDVDTKINLA